MGNSSVNDRKTIAIHRRAFLHLTSIGIALPSAFSSFLEHSAWGQTPESIPTPDGARNRDDLIVRQRQPDNLESPFEKISGIYTPNERFYVRSHFAVPELDIARWRLRVEGAVDRPLELSYQDILNLPATTVDATLECAGNGRSFLTPPVKGVQWGLGAVSHASWGGVPLGAILKKAGVRRQAVEVILEGADAGEPKDPPKPTGPIHFARSLPLTKALRNEVLIAHHMNGKTLPVAHGFPIRAVVPGWYGVASVKWLTRIVVTDRAFQGHFQTIDYAIWERSAGFPVRVPITELQIKSEIAQPQASEKIKAGTTYRVRGAAWTGDAEVNRVDISTDGGSTWEPAKLLGNASRFTWRLWEYSWNVPSQVGGYTLLARATDTKGNTQKLERQPDRENYMISHITPVPVEVYG